MISPSAETYWNRHASKYASKPIADQPSYEAKLEHVRSLLSSTDRILEIGCGTGGTALRLAPSCAHVTASDISAQMISYARSKKRDTEIMNIRFVHANATRGLEGVPFDKIIAFSLLHLVPDVQAVLRSAYDNLRPGGFFVSKTICLAETNIGIRTMIRVLKALRIAPDVNLLSQSGLRKHIEQAGFEVLETKYFGNQSIAPFIVSRRKG